jgi:hypothetical protein
MEDLSASIVTYKNPPAMLARVICSFLQGTEHSTLYIIDNSPTDALKYLVHNKRIKYFRNEKNIGFGAGHNIVLNKIIETSRYHVVLNPDVYFDADVITRLYNFMEEHEHVGHVMPKVLYPDGRLQHLCKLLPSPQTLIARRFLGFLKSAHNLQYELQLSDYSKVIDAPFLSGCFMFLRTEALRKVGLFDERFFLYTEDIDLTRRIHQYYRTVYYPHATIYHQYNKSSYNNFLLLLRHIQSAIKYFNKWGWTNDAEREHFNQRTLLQFANQA